MKIKNKSREKLYWDNFYTQKEFNIPSQFCTLLASENPTSTPIVEFGCGNGRDALFLARHGYTVSAIDLSEEAISKNNSKSKDIPNIIFNQGDVSILKDVTSPVEQIRKNDKNKLVIIYSRFFLHTLDDKQEKGFMTSLSQCLQTGDKIYFEFRSIEDKSTDKIYENHFRRYIDTDRYINTLTNQYNFEIEYKITGQGIAKYNTEDPFVSRVIARKK